MTAGPITHYVGPPSPNDADSGNFDSGVPGNRWSVHELYWVDGVFTYVIDGLPVLEIDPEHDPVGANENVYDPFSESGFVVLGFWDRFSSIASGPAGANFIVYDNLLIEEATAREVPDIQLFVDKFIPLSSSPDPDFDQDGDIDVAEFLTLQRGFGIGTTNAEGDTDFDEDVDGDDLATVLLAFGAGELPATAGVELLPEPSAVWLGLLAGLPLLLRTRTIGRFGGC
ncbi:MAG: hypothetical protein AAGA92_14655 [Planctomycetota bacterium]